MDRRRFLLTSLVGALAVPFSASAQPAAHMARIGMMVTASLESPEGRLVLGAFREGLREHGYREGQNIVIEYRSADGQVERFPALAAELARLKPALILAPNTPAGRAAQHATATIPIVVAAMGDPVGDGLVASLARPGGNITGLTFLGPELVRKRLQLLKEALPRASRVAALWHPSAFGESATTTMLKDTEAAAQNLGVELHLVAVRDPGEIVGAFSAMSKSPPDALIVFPGAMLFNERRHIIVLATNHRLPSMSGAREFVELGGLMAYGASITDLFRRSVGNVGKS